MPYGGISQYDISDAEMRWQVYTSLAIGSKGVLYAPGAAERLASHLSEGTEIEEALNVRAMVS